MYISEVKVCNCPSTNTGHMEGSLVQLQVERMMREPHQIRPRNSTILQEMRAPFQRLCALFLLLLGVWALILLVPYPILELEIVQTKINFSWLSERDGYISTSDIRKYCVERLNVPYNYSRDQYSDDVPDHYYAKLRYTAEHLYINDDYKFMYLAIPKVACSNWKRLLLQLKNVTNEGKLQWPHNNGDHKRLINLPKDQWRSVLQDYGYYKFIFVRNPWIRLVSAYVDRFTRHDRWWYNFIQHTEGRRMIRKYRRNATEYEIEDASDVRFEEFVRDILEHRQQSGHDTAVNLNEHWNTQLYISGVCHPWIQYDLIARYEDIDTQSVKIFNRLSLSESLGNFPKPARNSSTVRRAIVEYALLDSEVLRNLSKQLKADMDIFKYNVPIQMAHVIGET